MEKLIDFVAKDLTPEGMGWVVNNLEELTFLGKASLRQLIRNWRESARELSCRIKEADEKIKAIKGKTSEDIINDAKIFDNPEFPKVGLIDGMFGHSKVLAPKDVLSLHGRESDATTFNVCGWCKYNGSGTFRDDHWGNSYMISGDCSMITGAGRKDHVRKFNTPCDFTDADDLFIKQVSDGLENTLEHLIKEKRQIDNKIKLLLTLEKMAEQKPVIPGDRPGDWFKENDPVMCYLYESEGSSTKLIVKNQFLEGKVIRSDNDRCVEVKYDRPIHAMTWLNSHEFPCFLFTPCVMHLWEYEYLISHPDFLVVWLTIGSPGYYSSSILNILSGFNEKIRALGGSIKI